MSAAEVTPEKDARWALYSAQQECHNARLELTRAARRLDAGERRVRAAIDKLEALGVKP